MTQLEVEVVTAEGAVYGGVADKVTAPAYDGQVTILPAHTELLTILQAGELIIKATGDTTRFALTGGFMRVNRNRVTVFADAAERDSKIDIQRAEVALQRAQAKMASVEHDSAVEEAVRALTRAKTRIKVARRKSRRRQPAAGE